MKSLMQSVLGADWEKLPPALQAHYRFGNTTDSGSMDIEYPGFMQPYLRFLHLLGALITRRGKQVTTVVQKRMVGEVQYWERTMTYPDGEVAHFDTTWRAAGGNNVFEFVNPYLGLQMAVKVEDGKIHYEGVRFVVKLGELLITIPEWLVLGHTSIVEEAIDETHFAMDFRLTHPLLGQVFRYAGTFEVLRGAVPPAEDRANKS